MIGQKKRFSTFFRTSWQELLAPLTGKPALACAIALMATYASLDCPAYAPVLLAIVLAAFPCFPKSVQKAILITMVMGLLAHEINSTKIKRPPVDPPAKGCGNVEAILPRQNGYAFLVKSSGSKPYRVRITEKRSLPHLPNPGDSLCYEARWYPVTPPTVPGAFDTQGWLNSQGLAAYGKMIHWESRQGPWIPERSFLQFRMWIKSRFDDYLTPSETGLLLGLLAGDRSGIPEALRSDFQRSGLVHVLAISGFHVVLLAGMLMVFLKATRLPHKFARILAVILLFVYIPVTGGSPAVRRAVLMFSIPQLGALLQRPANAFNSLGFALLCILLPNPSDLWNPGFQLSAAATAGILVGNRFNPFSCIPESIRRWKIWKLSKGTILAPTYVTLCATFATAPFLIHHFKTLSPFAWLGNIVVVPAISWAMQAGLFALISPLDFLRQHFCYAASFFLRLASLLTRQLSDSAQASVTVGPFHPAVLLLLGALFLVIPAYRKNALAHGFSILCVLVFSTLFCIHEYNRILNPSWEMTVIDVGQGDGILLSTPGGKHILIDVGDNSYSDAGKDIIVPFLHHIGIQKLDVLVITHAHKDHFGGATSLLRMFPVKEIWTNSCALHASGKEWQEFLDEASERDIPIREVFRGLTWKENFFKMSALHPAPLSEPERDCADLNDGSITLKASGLGHSALLTGDLTIRGEKEILHTHAFVKSDILKVGHHGSKSSSGRNFIEAVAPDIALISSGRRNKFRHPHKQVIKRLDSLDIPYLNTASAGSIRVTFSPDTVIVETMLSNHAE